MLFVLRKLHSWSRMKASASCQFGLLRQHPADVRDRLYMASPGVSTSAFSSLLSGLRKPWGEVKFAQSARTLRAVFES